MVAQPLDVILRDGTTLRLRAPTRDDADALLEFFRGLSQQSLHSRYHGTPAVDAHLVEPLLQADGQEAAVLIGFVEDRIVAVANFARLRDPTGAEVAFAVADDYQRRGIGTRLLEQLAALAGAQGIERFLATVLPDNRQMLRVFEAAGFEVTRDAAGGEVELTFPIAPTERYLESVEGRDHEAVVASLRAFFEPSSVAVIGASPRQARSAASCSETSWPRTSRARRIRSIARPSPLRACAATRRWPRSRIRARPRGDLRSGRARAGSGRGRARERRSRTLRHLRGVRRGWLGGRRAPGPAAGARARARRADDRPELPRDRLQPAPRLNATFAGKAPRWGSIGFSSQSGALGLALIEAADARGIGLSAFVSIGNKADVSSNDLLERFEDDESTNLIALYLESFGNPRKFARIARRVSRTKPILALKSGRTSAGAKAAGSHTAALTSSDAAVEALFHQAGVIRAETLEELVDASVLLSKHSLPRGRRVAVLTNAGGLGILAADACEAAGLELPTLADESVARLSELLPVEASVANPVDMLGSATASTYEAVLPVLLGDSGVDAVLVLFVPPVTATADEVALAVARAACRRGEADRRRRDGRERHSARPPEAGVASLRVSGVRGARPRQGGRSRRMAAAAGRSVPALEGIDRDGARRIVAAALEPRSRRLAGSRRLTPLLVAYGIPVVEQRVAGSPEEAGRAAAELGFPVVVKTALAGAHKTETGGVVLDLQTEDDVREAATRIGGAVLVQPMRTGSAELLAGLVQDELSAR